MWVCGCACVCLCVVCVCVCWHFYLLPVIRAELTDHVIGDKLVEGRPVGRGRGGEWMSLVMEVPQ